jgi:hypothetical protein
MFLFGGLLSKTKCGTCLAVALAALLVSSTAFAHHSMSAYDRNRTATMKGTVTEFSFSNPHAELYFDVRDDKGTIQKWTAESPNPYRLAKSGWVKDSLKPGDEITVVGNPAKNGSPIMRLNKIIMANGQTLPAYSY